MSKLKINFYLKKEKIQDGKSAIYSKITLGSTSTTMATGKYICSKRWKTTKGLKLAKKVANELSLKNHLSLITDKIDDIYLKLEKTTKSNITAIDLKNSYLGKKETTFTLLKVIQYHNAHFKKRVHKGDVSELTLEKYLRVENILSTFIEKKYKKRDLPFEDINDEFVFSLDDYLRFDRLNGNTCGLSNNTTVKYFSNINTMFRYAKKRKKIHTNPFESYDKKLKEVDTIYLTPTELKNIEDLTFDSYRLETVRDIFLFSCYTSYAPVDAMKLTWNDITTDLDGDKWIRTSRKKSKVKSDMITLPPVIRIIKKYKNDPRCVNDNRLLPRYSNQKMNEYLKEIALLAGINKKITWYVSRHTFATTVCLSNRIPLEHVSKMMGHRKITQTQHYAKLTDEVLKLETNRLKQIFK